MMNKIVTIITATLSLVIFLAGPVTAGVYLRGDKSASGEWMVEAWTDTKSGFVMRIKEGETSKEYSSDEKGKVVTLMVYKVLFPNTVQPDGNVCKYMPGNPSEKDKWVVLIQEGYAVLMRNKVAVHTCYPATGVYTPCYPHDNTPCGN